MNTTTTSAKGVIIDAQRKQHWKVLTVKKQASNALRQAIKTWGNDIPEAVKPAASDLVFALNDLLDPDAKAAQKAAYRREAQVVAASNRIFRAIRKCEKATSL